MALALTLARVCAIVLVLAAAPTTAADTGRTLTPQRWSKSPHGRMLERILPPTVTPAKLPEPASEGARLTAQYCVQCHHLPNPAMHTAPRWESVVERMVWRMRGEGNLGVLMKEMMGDVRAPGADEVRTLTWYLQKYGQQEMDAAHPALRTETGEMYNIACTQCHALPDPRRHTAREWRAVVERMQGHMAWTNRVTGDPRLGTTPALDTARIVRFLQQNARPTGDGQ